MKQVQNKSRAPAQINRRDVLKWLSLTTGSAISFSCTQAALAPLDKRVQADPGRDGVLSIAYRCADLIIPPTDTPGALDAGVDGFIHFAVTQWCTADERARLEQGLGWLDEQARQRFGGGFITLDQARQERLLTQMEKQQSAAFAQLKELTVVGYFTSEIGATQALTYVPMPGYYDGDHKIDEQARAWSS